MRGTHRRAKHLCSPHSNFTSIEALTGLVKSVVVDSMSRERHEYGNNACSSSKEAYSGSKSTDVKPAQCFTYSQTLEPCERSAMTV
ncbi:hypothetical protein Y032_0160g3345 [Ancylostoma ceylanicum]|uniref:Uncharacterized protein n=1 Tax=Ancylostoma ceylanicum TaxID=53326 RepID=A0A016SYF6_9BILA|nr:hypothetical protein Y032_0160g3345 [Ancylostoma ceylanicum]